MNVALFIHLHPSLTRSPCYRVSKATRAVELTMTCCGQPNTTKLLTQNGIRGPRFVGTVKKTARITKNGAIDSLLCTALETEEKAIYSRIHDTD